MSRFGPALSKRSELYTDTGMTDVFANSCKKFLHICPGRPSFPSQGLIICATSRSKSAIESGNGMPLLSSNVSPIDETKT